MNVAQCHRETILVYYAVSTVLEIDEGPFPSCVVLADELGQLSQDLLKLGKVDVSVMV